jgi:hypothetical protein
MLYQEKSGIPGLNPFPILLREMQFYPRANFCRQLTNNFIIKDFVGKLAPEKNATDLASGLPDFSLVHDTKNPKNVANEEKKSQNGHKISQISAKYSEWT